MTQIGQKKNDLVSHFDFTEQALKYTQADGTGKKQIVIPYENIDIDSSYTVTVGNRSQIVPSYSIFFAASLAMGIVFKSENKAEMSFFMASIFLGLGIMFLLFSFMFKTKLTIYRTKESLIRIIQEKNHDKVVSELVGHWRKRMREIYATLDLAKDADATDKLTWLFKHEVLTEQEYRAARSKFLSTDLATEPNKSSLH